MKEFELKGTAIESYARLRWMCILLRKEWPVTIRTA